MAGAGVAAAGGVAGATPGGVAGVAAGGVAGAGATGAGATGAGAGGVCARLVAAHTSTALAALPSVANRVRFRNFEWFIIVVTIGRLLRPRPE